ncbi:MAG: 23S rRNA (guanosine(2251)-2'-O)-methyltransferase RlmB [Alphaproteobacteria bacterium GM7ARS4]|nr:23S rRNA (guanosine(2251)-2'-O)-methyltransferase RlmB [Alphaproteobacteria bacterium GM7ARS4]
MKKNIDKHPWLYGIHAVREALLNRHRHVHRIWIQERKDGAHHPLYAIAQAHRQGQQEGHLHIVPQRQLESVLPPHAVHQGVAAHVSPLACPPWKTYCRDKTMLVILDHIQDPHNIGAIIRSAWVFGVDGVLTTARHSPPLNGVIAKTACGGIEHVPLLPISNVHHALLFLKTQGFHIFGLDAHGKTTLPAVCACSMPSQRVLVMGQEGRGLRHLTRAHCDNLVSIPYARGETYAGAGKDGERDACLPETSLNVSVSAGIALYAMTARQA